MITTQNLSDFGHSFQFNEGFVTIPFKLEEKEVKIAFTKPLWRLQNVVYGFFNKSNNQWLIGNTAQYVCKRLSQHIYLINNPHVDTGGNDRFYQDIRKTPSNFIFTLLHQSSTKEWLGDLETFYIKAFNSIQEGYNIRLGGGGGTALSHKVSLMSPNRSKIPPALSPLCTSTPTKTYPIAIVNGQIKPLFTPSVKEIKEANYGIQQVVNGCVTLEYQGSSNNGPRRVRSHLQAANHPGTYRGSRALSVSIRENPTAHRIAFFSRNDPNHRENEKVLIKVRGAYRSLLNKNGGGGGSNGVKRKSDENENPVKKLTTSVARVLNF